MSKLCMCDILMLVPFLFQENFVYFNAIKMFFQNYAVHYELLTANDYLSFSCN
jgi:hypothetical protein